MSDVLLICDDMLFSSRITGTAGGLGIPIQTCKTSASAIECLKDASASCVIVDLSNPGLQIVDFVATLREASDTLPFIVAFGSHVDTEILRTARAAGCDIVWPRSKFADELQAALPMWIARN